MDTHTDTNTPWTHPAGDNTFEFSSVGLPVREVGQPNYYDEPNRAVVGVWEGTSDGHPTIRVLRSHGMCQDRVLQPTVRCPEGEVVTWTFVAPAADLDTKAEPFFHEGIPDGDDVFVADRLIPQSEFDLPGDSWSPDVLFAWTAYGHDERRDLGYVERLDEDVWFAHEIECHRAQMRVYNERNG